MKNTRTRRVLSLLLSMTLLLSQMGLTALAAESATYTPGNLCEHHPAHTAECGYSEDTPCTHEHIGACYTDEPICGLAESGDEIATDSGAPHTHTQECYELDCPHASGQHDDTCGYEPAAPCAYDCEICNSKDSGDVSLGVSGITVTGFDALSGDVHQQAVPVGTALESLNLPAELSARGYTVAEDAESVDSGTQSDATPDAAPITIEGVKWELDPAKEINDGNDTYSTEGGSYCFTPILHENYTLTEGVSLPEIWVMVGGANVLTEAAVHNISTGDLILTDESNSGSCPGHTVTGTTTQYKIVVQSGEHDITLDGVDIQTSNNTSPLDMQNAGKCVLTLQPGTINRLDGSATSDYGPGVRVSTNRLTITGTGKLVAKGGASWPGIGRNGGGDILIESGVVEAIGGSYAAGIGGAQGQRGCSVEIIGGTVTATGGYYGAGIGGGTWGSGGNITINEGTVTATSGSEGAGIGGGYGGSGGTTTINGGTVMSRGSGGGADIGGGNRGADGNVTISGGAIYATNVGIRGVFSTGMDGNAFIMASSISDKSGKEDGSWRGVIFMGGSGVVYGTQAIDFPVEVPSGTYFEVPEASSVTFAESVTNAGNVHVLGSLTAETSKWTNEGQGKVYQFAGGTVNGLSEDQYTEVSADTFVTFSDLTVTGGVYGTDYTYNDLHNAITVIGSTPLIFSGGGSIDNITVAGDITADITLNDVNIQFSDGNGWNGIPGTNAISLQNGAALHLTLTGQNTLKSGVYKAGILVPGGTSLTIDGTGSLMVTGDGAGIGGNYKESTGAITINGGTVTARSSGGGADIGSGKDGTSGVVTINGGAVYAANAGINGTFSTGTNGHAFVMASSISDRSGKEDGSWHGVIFMGCNGTVYGNVTINSACNIQANKGLIVPKASSVVFAESVTNAGNVHVLGSLTAETSKWANEGQGKVYQFAGGTVNGLSEDQYTEVSEDTFVTFRDLTVTGGIYGTDYTYSDLDNAVTVIGNTALVFSGGGSIDKITVASGVNADITLDGVNIQFSNGHSGESGTCAFELQNGSVANLTLVGSNTLKSGWHMAGLQVPDGTAVTINGTGSLTATSGGYGAGIGGGYNCSGGVITVKGGSITANGGERGAGIGCGFDGGKQPNGGVITIHDGTITATGGKNAAGIGGGAGHPKASIITINGGLVTAASSAQTANTPCIGGGDWPQGAGQCGTIIINGGTIRAAIVGGEKWNDKVDSITINGGSLKTSTFRYISPKTSDKVDVFMGKLENQSGITDVSVDQTPYYIYRNYTDDNTIYLHMTGADHSVQVKKSDGNVFTYTATYVSGGVSGNTSNGYFTFSNSTETTPATDAVVTFDRPSGYTVPYKTPFQSVTLTVLSPNNAKVNGRSAAMHSVLLTIKQNGITLWSGREAVKGNTCTFTLDTAILEPGNYTLSAEYGGSDVNKPSQTSDMTLIITKATPTLSLSAASITYGQALSDSILSGSAIGVSGENVPGTFAWTNDKSKPSVSDSNSTDYGVTFTPSDMAHYTTATTSTKIVVSKAMPTISSEPTATTITYGQALSDSTLSSSATGVGGESVTGAFTWTNDSTKPSVSDSNSTVYNVVFTSSNTNYANTTTNAKITVNKAEPTTPLAPTQPSSGTVTTHNSITIETAIGQKYICTTSNSTPNIGDGIGWTESTDTTHIFTDLVRNTQYYLWTYTLSSANYNASAVSPSLTVTTAKETVTIVNVLGITPPSSKDAPDTDAQGGIGWTAGMVTWYKGSETHTGAFDYTTAYTAKVTLTAATGYEFPASVTAQVGGQTAAAQKERDGTLTVSYTYPVTAAQGQTAAPAFANSTYPMQTATATTASFTLTNKAGDYKLYDQQAGGMDGVSGVSISVDDNTLTLTLFNAPRTDVTYYISATNTADDLTESPCTAITVKAYVATTGVNLNKSTLGLKMGGNETLTATIMPDAATNKMVTWVSSDSTVAMVDVTGKVTAIKAGTATIIATAADRQIATCAVTITQPSSGGSTDSDNDTPPYTPPAVVTPPATPEQPNPPTNGSTTLPGKPDKDGNVGVSIPDRNITDAINAAKKQVGRNGISITVKFNITQTANSLTVTISKAVLDKLIVESVKSLKIESNLISYSLNLEALKEIQKSVAGSLTITAKKLDGKALSPAAQKAIGNRPVFDFAMQSGGRSISAFGRGSASIWMPYAPAKSEAEGSLQAVYVDGKGGVAWIIDSSYNKDAKALLFSADHFSIYGVGHQTVPAFTDTLNHWAKDDIEFVAARGLLSGTGATTFSPDMAVTRGMFVTALWRLAETPQADESVAFTDVPSTAYYYNAVKWAAKNGIVSGTSSTTFAPDKAITRQEMAVIMQNYAKAMNYTLPKTRTAVTFADNTSISSWAAEAVNAMQMAGVLVGKSGNRFDSQGTATRAEVSALLRRFVDLVIDSSTAQGWMQNDSGQWMYYENGKPVTGKRDIGGTTYTFGQYGEIADMPKNLIYDSYTVKKGDSWWKIAHEQNCNIYELVRVNGKTIFSIIYGGDILKIPQKG